jgi:hypothetical protein
MRPLNHPQRQERGGKSKGKVKNPTQAKNGLEWATLEVSEVSKFQGFKVSRAKTNKGKGKIKRKDREGVGGVASHLSVERRDAKVGHPADTC